MAFPEPHYYLSIGGPLVGGETWSIGLRLQRLAAAQTRDAEQATCDALMARITTWWGSQAIVGNGALLQTVKYNRIGIDGRYQEAYTIRADKTTGQAGGSASPYPQQIALVATLETGATRGYAHQGRIFLPAPALAMGTDKILSVVNAQAAATAVKGLIDSINAETTAGPVMIGSAVGGGTFRVVTAVGVGRVLDTMRSRRRQLVDRRETVALAAVT